MNIFIPNYKETFRVKEDTTVELNNSYRFTGFSNEKKDLSEILEENGHRIRLTIPKGTILEIKSIRVRKSEFNNYITFLAHHPIFEGMQYKTVGKLLIDFIEDDMKQLKSLDVEILDDTSN